MHMHRTFYISEYFTYSYLGRIFGPMLQFVSTQLNDQTVLTIQFSASDLFALSLKVKQFYLTHRSVLALLVRVDLRAMGKKSYSAFPKAPALLEPQNQIV